MYVEYRAMYDALRNEDWEKVVEKSTEGDKVQPKRKPDALRKLAAARAHWELGQLTAAERNADRAIAASKKNGDWRRGQIRALAVSLGANSAIKRGDSETALRFFAFAMRADPDTPLFKTPYKGIKASQKAIADADIKLDRGESRQAMDSADSAAATLRGLGAEEDGAMFADIDARRCRAHAQMRAFELALGACERQGFFFQFFCRLCTRLNSALPLTLPSRRSSNVCAFTFPEVPRTAACASTDTSTVSTMKELCPVSALNVCCAREEMHASMRSLARGLPSLSDVPWCRRM